MNNYSADVLIHIDENLDHAAINGIEEQVSMLDGVVSACVHENTPHLMIVDFDSDNIHAADVLNTVVSSGYHAELIGL
jgi:hypothetical protein